uniref:Uncharacterized protein n=1 Tax=Romanomermis culicivorax TaxID=13658 RepID=A0A915JBQ8_ROMCU
MSQPCNRRGTEQYLVMDPHVAYGQLQLQQDNWYFLVDGIQITHIGNNVVVMPIGKQPSAPVTGAKGGDDLEVDKEVTVESSFQPDEEKQ